MESNFRIAVKAFAIHDNKLLLLKRRSDDPHKPGEWDIPGGRLEAGEDPFQGLEREVREETGLAVEPIVPAGVHHFVRGDGQRITMIIFVCRSESTDILLSEEHQEYEWHDLDAPLDSFPLWLQPVVTDFRAHIVL